MGKWDQYQVDTTPTTNKWAQFEISDSSQPVPSAQPVEAQKPSVMDRLGNMQLSLLTPPLKDYPATIASFANQALGGIPKALYEGQPAPAISPVGARLSNYGYMPQPNTNQYPEPQSWQGKLWGGTGMAVPFGVAEQGANLATRAIPQIAQMAAAHPAITRGVVGATAGLLSNLPKPEEYAGRAASMAAGNMIITPLIEKFFHRKTFRTLSDIRVLPEGQLAKLPSIERQAYFSARNIEDQQLIAQERQVLGQKYQDTINKIRQDQRTLGQAAPAVAAKRLEHLSEPFAQLRVAQNKAYTNGIKEALAGAPEGDVFFTKDEINQALAQKYLQPSFPGQPPVMLDDPTEYRQLIDLLHNHEIVNKNEMSARDLLQIADKEFSGVSAASKGGLKSYTPPEVAHTKLRDILLNLLESKGIDVRSVKADWAQWVPIRNLGYKLQSPSGPSQVIRIVKGLDPVRAGHLDQLEALIGQPLRGEVRGLFNQLDELAQQKILEGTKQLEANRLLNQKIGFMKGSRIEQKLRIDQLAQHHDNVSKLIFEAAKGAAQAAGIGAVAGGAYLAHKALTQ